MCTLQSETFLRYPIVKTSVSLNLINKEELPKLSRHVLLALVEWVKRHQNTCDTEFHGLEINSKSTSFDLFIETNGIEEIKLDAKGDDK